MRHETIRPVMMCRTLPKIPSFCPDTPPSTPQTNVFYKTTTWSTPDRERERIIRRNSDPVWRFGLSDLQPKPLLKFRLATWKKRKIAMDGE